MGGRQLRVASRSSARTPRRWRRSSRSASACPTLRTIVVIDPAGDAADADLARRAARARARRATPAELERAHRRRHARGPVHVHLHVGHDRPAEGLRAHARQLPRGRSTCASELGVARGGRRRLPLPAARARLRAADPARWRSTSARRSPTSAATRSRSSPELQEVKPTYLPSVPRIFEKIYTLRHLAAARPGADRRRRRSSGVKVRDAAGRRRGGPGRAAGALRRRPTRQLFENVRDVFGGQLRQAITGAAPIAQGDPRVLLRLRRAGARGLRDDRDRDGRRRTRRSSDHQLRHGRPRAARRRGQDRRRRRGPDQGPEHLPGLLQERRRDASARSSTAGCTPATSARSTRTATSPSPAARRTSSSPRAARTSRRPTSRTTSSSRAGSPRPSCTATAGPTRSRWSRSTRRRSCLGRSEHGLPEDIAGAGRATRRCAS